MKGPWRRAITFFRHLSLDRLLVCAAFLLVATIALLVPTQNDTWWHMAAGRDMVATGHVALTETWSHTAAGARWANYEWLTQVLFVLLYRAGGLPLLTIFSALLILGAYSLIWSLTRGPEVPRSLLLIAVVANSTAVWAIRPQIVTMFLLATTLRLIATRRVLWLPPLFVVWANLHGAVALGGLAIIAALVAALMADRALLPRLMIAAALSFAAGMLTPLGWRYWLEIGLSIGRSRVNRIHEWQPPPLELTYAVFFLAVAALVALAVARPSWTKRFDDAALTAAALLLMPLALGARRNVPVFLLAALPAISRLNWSPASTSASPPAVEPWRARIHAAALGLSAVAALLVVGHRWTQVPSPQGWTPMTPSAAEAIRDCPEPLYNPYNEGGFLVWFVPERKVFLDSRQDPYPVELVQAHIRAEQTGEYDELFERYSIRCAVFPESSSGPARLRARGWHERFRDSQWIVLERERNSGAER